VLALFCCVFPPSCTLYMMNNQALQNLALYLTRCISRPAHGA
jgi:hypothetical protein